MKEGQANTGGGGRPGHDDDLRIPRLSFFELMPRRSLRKVVLLLFILVAIIALKRGSTRMVRSFTDVLYPEFQTESEAPRVRMGTPPAPQP
jgi:hypothetical protein